VVVCVRLRSFLYLFAVVCGLQADRRLGDTSESYILCVISALLCVILRASGPVTLASGALEIGLLLLLLLLLF